MKAKGKQDQIKERFPGKQINRLASFRRECPLTIHERLIFSFLAYRCRREGKLIAASIRKLARLSGMHRDTVAKALRSLATYKLVQRPKKQWKTIKIGREEHPEWFGWRGQGREIKDIAYHYFPQPAEASPLSIIDALIYCADVFDPGNSIACLAGRFGISWNTVKRSRSKLASLEYTPDWFRDAEFAVKPKRPKGKSDFLDSYRGAEKYLVAKMLAISQPAWPQQDIERFLRTAREKCPTQDGYDNLMFTLTGNAVLCGRCRRGVSIGSLRRADRATASDRGLSRCMLCDKW